MTPRTAAGRVAHEWWHSVALPLVGASPSHDHPFGCEFQRVVQDIEAEAAALDVVRMAFALALVNVTNHSIPDALEHWESYREEATEIVAAYGAVGDSAAYAAVMARKGEA